MNRHRQRPPLAECDASARTPKPVARLTGPAYRYRRRNHGRMHISSLPRVAAKAPSFQPSMEPHGILTYGEADRRLGALPRGGRAGATGLPARGPPFPTVTTASPFPHADPGRRVGRRNTRT